MSVALVTFVIQLDLSEGWKDWSKSKEPTATGLEDALEMGAISPFQVLEKGKVVEVKVQ